MGEVVTLCAGLTKKVTKAGGGERPQQGDRCSMHYTGTLEDGTTFDTSRTRPAPFYTHASSHSLQLAGVTECHSSIIEQLNSVSRQNETVEAEMTNSENCA